MKNKGCSRFLIILPAVAIALCLILAAFSAITNRALPEHSTVVDRLSDLDKVRLAEIDHLRQSLGNEVLPGWAEADIPLIVYNEENIFLTGIANPANGWQTVQAGAQRGAPWQVVPDKDFSGQPYYWQPVPPDGTTTQAFTVRVGEAWAASLTTYEWTKITLIRPLRDDLPAPLRPIVPFVLVSRIFIPGSDAYASYVLHEAAHAYQGIRAPERLAAGERASRENEAAYPWDDEAFTAAWQAELDILSAAMRAGSEAEVMEKARRFIELRANRRAAARLSPQSIAYENHREWVEGIAKYAERKIYVLASDENLYAPLPETQADPEFRSYRYAHQKWEQEIDQARRMASDYGDGRFYYSGFGQAVMLDRLSPGWKDRLFEDGVFLEDLLAEAVQ